jgi:hypothetical protein
MVTHGFFMLGFPTETVEEMKATVDFAATSRLTMAYFFSVVPQPATRLFDLAKAEDATALEGVVSDEGKVQSYRADFAWYQRAYGFDLSRFMQIAYARFYLAPRRVAKIVARVPTASLLAGLWRLIRLLLWFGDGTGGSRARRARGSSRHGPSRRGARRGTGSP